MSVTSNCDADIDAGVSRNNVNSEDCEAFALDHWEEEQLDATVHVLSLHYSLHGEIGEPTQPDPGPEIVFSLPIQCPLPLSIRNEQSQTSPNPNWNQIYMMFTKLSVLSDK